MNDSTSDTILKNAYWFLFYKDELLIKQQKNMAGIPTTSDIKEFVHHAAPILPIGEIHGRKCFIANINQDVLPPGFFFEKVRPLYGNIEDEYYWLACRAFHIMNWLKTSKFCGCCGNAMFISSTELAMECPQCGHIVYPRISPAIIVAVIRDNKILLARSNRFPPNRYSVIAGFVEPGETLEQCVKRELQEEVGVKVHNIKYFSSQPWPFPDSLMVAFTAQCSSSAIKIDNQEIVAADWFTPYNLPDIPDNPSVARQLIDWFTKNYK